MLTASGRKPAPQALLDALAAQGVRATFLTGDLSDPGACAALAARTLDALGGLDAFVSNAGASVPHRLAELAVEDWDRTFAVNTRPTFLLAQAFRPALAASRGSIVAVASMSGLRPHRGLGAYSAAKAALVMLVRVLAQEWAADGIRVNAVAPGMIRTPLTERIYLHADVKARREALVPLGRIGTPEDIAGGGGLPRRAGVGLRHRAGAAGRRRDRRQRAGAIPGLPAIRERPIVAALPTTCDVLVVGSGAGGLATAVVAAFHGLEVLVVEKEPVLGGTTAWSGGWLWIPRNPLAVRAGIVEDEADRGAISRASSATRRAIRGSPRSWRTGRRWCASSRRRPRSPSSTATGCPDFHATPGARDRRPVGGGRAL